MYPKILLFLLPVALLLIVAVFILLWDKAGNEVKQPEAGNGKPEGAFRAFYHGLWILALWTGLALSLPLWFSYKQKIISAPMDVRWVLVAKILVFPMILLALLRYGAKRGYLKWIDSLQWPEKENQ